jgi:hypothetical protein
MARSARLLLLTIVATFGVLRLSLMLSPNSDLNVAGYNVHHLFTGVLVMFAGGVWRVLGSQAWLPLVVFGVGSGLALDEVVYLIATDGSNAAYLTRVSWIGGVITVVVALVYVAVVDRVIRRRRSAA